MTAYTQLRAAARICYFNGLLPLWRSPILVMAVFLTPFSFLFFLFVIERSAGNDLLATGVADLFHRSGIRAKPVGDDLLRSAICLHDAPEKLQRRSFVPRCSDHRLQDLAFVIDGAPEIAELAVDLHEDLVQLPPPLRIAAHMRHASLADLGGEHWAKPVPPEPDGLVADVDPALGQQILDVAQ
jgi:hypothetical protein